ncbi:MAG: quinolinate synthase NadA [Acidobacteriia bacterium]|nr:quinolinate synthase NadA [Terriglobia bacterium]
MQILPEPYASMTDAEAVRRIAATRERLGRDVLILGHHYQRDEVVAFADFTGDSYGLAKASAARADARWIVFCGVHFMAETADILAAPEQRVILPDLEAGCSMADMAEIDSVEVAWEEMATAREPDGVVPVTYVNSSAAVKAFVGTRGGTVCTSSNAGAIYDWALSQGKSLFFLPDQHLGRNMGAAKGIPLDRMRLWDPTLESGGLTRGEIGEARVLLWKGHCQVHARFAVGQIEALRASHPGILVLVHWECSLDVVRAADDVGSTSDIIRRVEEAPAGSVIAIGTELHLVSRLARAHTDRRVLPLVTGTCVCATMNRIDPQHLLFVLDELAAERIINEVEVPEDIARPARVALTRMLEISRRAETAPAPLAVDGGIR